MIAEHPPLRCLALETVVFKNASSARVNIQIEVIDEHLAPVEKDEPENVDLVVALSGITTIDSE